MRDGSPLALLNALADRNPAFAERWRHAPDDPIIDTVGSVPYGWIAQGTDPGLYRIGDQAADMGGITHQQSVEIGKKAKEFTLYHLGKNPFTLHTEWDSPFNDKRYHGFIKVSYNGKKRFLHELLVQKGHARIHTKGSQLPGGTSEGKQEDHLYDLQRTAKSAKAGAWSL